MIKGHKYFITGDSEGYITVYLRNGTKLNKK